MTQPKIKTVIFVCTANYYRSRYSEHLFNVLVQQRRLPWRATSRGLRTWMLSDTDGPISDFTVWRLAAQGIDVAPEHRNPTPLAEADLRQADLVICLKEAEHRPMMLEQFPDWADRIEYWHVDDLDCATADEALPVCQQNIEALVERLAATAPAQPKPARKLVRRAG